MQVTQLVNRDKLGPAGLLSLVFCTSQPAWDLEHASLPRQVGSPGPSNLPRPSLLLSLRSASFSQGTRASFLMRSDTAVQKLAQGNGHCVNGVSGQVHGFYSLPKPSRHNTEFRDSTYDLPRSLASHGHTKGSLTGSETDNEDVYTFKTPSNTLCREFGDLLVDNMDVPATPLSAYQIPRTFTLDKNHNAMAVATPGDSAIAPPPRPPKPSQAETPRWGSPQQRPPINESSRSVSAAATIPRRNTLPAMDNSRLHRGWCKPQPRPWGTGGSLGVLGNLGHPCGGDPNPFLAGPPALEAVSGCLQCRSVADPAGEQLLFHSGSWNILS